jgi:RNA polymerase sigma factor (sigma-70 family)
MTGISGAAFIGVGPRSGAARQFEIVNADRATERFREVVLPHLGDALALARWLTGSSHDAEDVVQDACIRALAGIGNYDGRNARAWVLTIVRNTSFTWLAKHRSKTLVMVGDMSAIDEASQGTGEPGPTPEAELIRKADAATIEQAIAALPHVFRETLVLRDVSGLSYKEIASMLALPIGTVMSRLSRARLLLATAIERAQ